MRNSKDRRERRIVRSRYLRHYWAGPHNTDFAVLFYASHNSSILLAVEFLEFPRSDASLAKRLCINYLKVDVRRSLVNQLIQHLRRISGEPTRHL